MSVPLVQLFWICLANSESKSVGHYGSVKQICFKLRPTITITSPDLTELQFDWQIKRFRACIHPLWPFEEKWSPSFPDFLFFWLEYFFLFIYFFNIAWPAVNYVLETSLTVTSKAPFSECVYFVILYSFPLLFAKLKDRLDMHSHSN